MSRITINRIVAVLLLSMIVAACAGPKAGVAPGPVTAGTVDEAHARWSDTDSKSLEDGRLLMLANCNRCHAYPSVTNYTEAEWPNIMIKMGRKAKLTDVEREWVTRFIIAWRADMLNRGATNAAD